MAATLTFTASEANRNFSRILREVAQGCQVRVTSHGRDVALISAPEQCDSEHARKLKAVEALKAHWSMVTPVTVGPWTREQLYDRN